MLVSMVVLAGPQLSYAQLLISEIQYNPEGTDGGYEWIEVHNSGTSALSLEGVTFRESDQNHRLSHTNETLGWLIPAGGFAIIADNPTKFLEKHPGFPGLLFDSSFSLLNTGELLELLHPDGELLYGFEYNPEWGGSGDGSTLGIVSDTWQATNITPGHTNTGFVTQPEEPDENTNSPGPEPDNPDTQISETPISTAPETYIRLQDPDYETKTIKADAGPDKTVLAGVPFLYTGQGFGLTGGVLDDPEYRWNFGDTTRASGREVLHTYYAPGSYIGSLTVTSGKYKHTDQFEVLVLQPEIYISGSEQEGTISLENHSANTIEISGFAISHNNQSFTLPENSFIKGKSKITLPVVSLDIDLQDAKRIYLRGPDNKVINSYLHTEEQIKTQISLIEQEVLVLETEAQENITDVGESAKQMVYIGVPQYVQEPVATGNVFSDGAQAGLEATPPSPQPNQNPQAASLPVPQKSSYELYELVIAALLVLGGLWGLFFYQKQQKPDLPDIREVE